MKHRNGRAGTTRALVTTELASDYANECTAIIGAQERDIFGFQTLIARLDHFLGCWQIHPELDPVKQASRKHQ